MLLGNILDGLRENSMLILLNVLLHGWHVQREFEFSFCFKRVSV